MFITCILPLLLVTYRDSRALPVSSSNVTSLLWDNGMLSVIDSTDPEPQSLRTLFGVAWSCSLTVLICAWTSVHPNVPPQAIRSRQWTRIKLMFWTIVAPELVLAWAVRQRSAAKEVKDLYNKRKGWKCWTMKHGHLLVMGGYQLGNGDFEENESRLEVLTVDRFKKLIEENPNFEFPRMTVPEINDYSKGDGLSKLLAILQVSWFIIQCLARHLQGLALTELELVTLAMASLNAITYGFWWNKPLSVARPVVYVKEPTGEKVDRTGNNGDENEDSEEELEMDRIARAVIAPLVAHNHDIQIPDHIRDILDPRKHWLTTSQASVELIQAETATEWRPATLLFLLWMISKIYGALRLLFVWLPLFLLFNLTYYVIMFFPVGISILLFLIKTEKVEERQGPNTVATRVIRPLRKWRYALTHSIRQHFVGMLPVYKKSPIKSWFFLFPASFFLLVLALLILSPFFAIAFIASLTFTAVFEIATTSKVPLGATHVPSFYSPRTRSDRYSRMVVFAIFGVVFGGIHCFGWNFVFPTHSERLLWRYTSLVLSAIPLVVAPIDFILENSKREDRWWKILRLFLDIFMTVLLFVYVPARLSLIAQALALLRDQPPTAYIAVDWTRYIPHLF